MNTRPRQPDLPRRASRRGRRHDGLRRGTALIELAVCLPLLVFLVMGSVEAANLIFLKQRLCEVAYEGARTASAIGGTKTAAETRCTELGTALKINGMTVAITPAVTGATSQGTMITVTATASGSNNSIVSFTPWFKGNVQGIVFMAKL